MNRSGIRRRVVIPSISSRKSQTKDYEFVKGWNSNISNDSMPNNQWRYVTDAREIQIGKWDTRKGNDFFSVPIGEAVNVQQTSTTGASTFTFSNTRRFAKKITATATGPVTSIEVNIENDDAATGTIVYALYTDSSGAPGAELFRTTVAASVPTGTLAYLKGRSITLPTITNTTVYWVVGYVQAGGTSTYKVSTTTNAATGLTSTNSGSTWSAASLDFNVKVSTATAGGVKGVTRVRRNDGTMATFMAHGSTLYSINEGTGATTSIDAGLNASATYCRFEFANDILYYVTGLQEPRKYDFSTASEVSAAPENASHIMEHKGIMFFASASDVTKLFYTNFAAFETFTSTDFIYVPAPKTGDPVTALAKLNGLMYTFTRHNKYILYGSTNASFRLESAIGKKGTFSQESVTWDEDNMYFATDDGIYKSNGAEEKNITTPDILNSWLELLDKDNAVLELHSNRLYVWYTPNGSDANTRCFIYNILYDIWESDDTKALVGRSFTKIGTEDYFIQASNRCGMLMLGEQSTNDYNSMGEPLTYELRTRYEHYETPAQYKRASHFRPHFDTVEGTYSIQVGYATDYSDSPTYFDVSLVGSGIRFDAGHLFDDDEVFGGATQVNPLDSAPTIAGEWRRLQIRYKHDAAREPVSFDGHVLSVETQRLI